MDDAGRCFVPIGASGFSALSTHTDDFVRRYLRLGGDAGDQLYEVIEEIEEEQDEQEEEQQKQKDGDDATHQQKQPQHQQKSEETSSGNIGKSKKEPKTNKIIAVEIGTLTDLLNRDVNLNVFGSNEPRVTVAIIPQ